MMGTRDGGSNRSGYVSWCVDSAEQQHPAGEASTDAAPHTFPHQSQRSAGSSCTSLLSQAGTGREEKGPACLHQPFIRRRRHKTSSNTPSSLRSCEKASGVYSVEDEGSSVTDWDGGPSEAEVLSEPPRHPEGGNFPLRRASPIISRHARPVFWNRGGSSTSNPLSKNFPSPSSGSSDVGQTDHLSVSGMTGQEPRSISHQHPFRSQVDNKQRSISLSSNLNSLQSKRHHLHGTQHALDKEQRGWSLNSCHLPHMTELFTSSLNNKDRNFRGILDFPADLLKTSCELEKENAHFVVVDMVLEVLEGAKCTLSFDQWISMTDENQNTPYKMSTSRRTSSVEDKHEHGSNTDHPTQENHKHPGEDMRTLPTDAHSVSAQQHVLCEAEEEAGNHGMEHQTKSLSILSTDSGFEDCLSGAALTPTDSLRNAEWLAQRLVLEFKRKWLPSHALRRGRQSLRSSLQELPGTEGVEVSCGSLSEEIQLRTRMRGSLNWAPPRFQIIFSVQPSHRRSEVVALQHHLCAGCGTEVEPRYIKKLRYCDYLGRYFCVCCHSGSESVIPGRVLACWDFSRYSVSDFSKQLLDSVWRRPLFDLSCVGKPSSGRVKELDKFKEIQEQLLDIRKLLTACRFATRLLAEFNQLPSHLLEQPILFSMDDLLRAKKGQLVAQARAVLNSAIEHVENCQLCLARGFICEFCRQKDIIFPFQRDICRRCTVCKACFHKHCFADQRCPKCTRIQSRAKVQV